MDAFTVHNKVAQQTICFINTELNVSHLILDTTITMTNITHNTPSTQAKQDGLKKQLARTESLEKKLLRQLQDDFFVCTYYNFGVDIFEVIFLICRSGSLDESSRESHKGRSMTVCENTMASYKWGFFILLFLIIYRQFVT